MWDLIISVPDHCLSFYFTCIICVRYFNVIYHTSHLPITRMRNRDQYRMSIRGVSGLALGESKIHTFSRI